MEVLENYLTASTESVVAKQVVKGNQYVPEAGTWGHPDLAIFFARWISPSFSFWCDKTIKKILEGEESTGQWISVNIAIDYKNNVS